MIAEAVPVLVGCIPRKKSGTAGLWRRQRHRTVLCCSCALEISGYTMTRNRAKWPKGVLRGSQEILLVVLALYVVAVACATLFGFAESAPSYLGIGLLIAATIVNSPGSLGRSGVWLR